MPSPPATPNQKTKPVLPAPTFKYGSNTYVLLAYAKMKKTPFSVVNVRALTGRYKNDYEVKRSLEVLINNKSVRKINDEQWQITATGVQQVIDFARRRDLPNNIQKD
jgi:hypothetical protein